MSTSHASSMVGMRCALEQKDLGSYWAASGGSKLLADMLMQADLENIDIENCAIDKYTMEDADVSTDNVPLFLYQSGYLTITDYNGRRYKLGIPNKEVKRALYDVVLPNALRKRRDVVSSSIIRMQDALVEDDIEEMMKNLKQLFAETPYSQNSNEYFTEERYRFIMRQTFSLVGCRIEEEKQMAKGRIDLVAKFEDKVVMVFELKMDNNGGVEAAKKQLKENDYISAFSNEKAKVYGIAISFSSKKRGIENYEVINQPTHLST